MRAYLHVILLTLFIISIQGCSSTEKKEESFSIETPQIETSTTSQSSDVSEVVVRGEPGAAIYVNGNKVGVVGDDGTATIELEIPQGDESTLQTLVLKDEAGNKSEPVVFTLNPQNTQTPDDNKQENNTSTDSNETNSSADDKNETIATDNNVTAPKPTPPPTTSVATLKSLKLTADKTTLNKDTNTTVNVMATFSDNTTKEVSKEVEWIMTPKNTLNIKNQNLKALQDGNITLEAKLGNILSNNLHVNVFWETNGHRLPPKPDETVNNSTLLGIDSNNNDVRDDVERWIYEEYKDKHPIHIDIAMQAGRAWQKVLEKPSKAKEIHDLVRAPASCQSYYMNYAEYFNEKNLIKKRIITKFFVDTIIFNTEERKRAFIQYDILLSGDSYKLPKPQDKKTQCDFNLKKYEE